jgi:hypothetical protein
MLQVAGWSFLLCSSVLAGGKGYVGTHMPGAKGNLPKKNTFEKMYSSL